MLAYSQNIRNAEVVDERFFEILIPHYEERTRDTSIPIMVRADMKKTLSYYKTERDKLNRKNQLHHSKIALPC
jgi:hypothetical protein